MARTVVASDASAIETEDDRQSVQSDVVDDLIPCAVQERGVQRHYWA